MKFAEPVKQAVHQLYAVPYSCEYYEKEFGNVWKDTPQPEFFGKTPRELYISISEDFAKKHSGNSVFGRILARRIEMDKSHNVFLISDSGFVEEALPLALKFGAENILIVELDRPGCSFEGDSRQYIGELCKRELPMQKIKVQRLPNVGDRMLLRTLLHGVAVKYLGLPAETI
jgi:hypothetical protein